MTFETTVAAHVDELFKKIKKEDKKINSYLNLNDTALASADKVTPKARKNKAGKLAGLHLGVKSIINVEGLVTSCGSKVLENYVAPYDADVITRIKMQDGVIVGALNCDEFASGASGEHSAFGVTRNPNNLDYITGGSSSGSAAAVAAGLCDLSLGTDTGGSIRNPASHCGVVGIKPSYGRVSRYGLCDLAMSLDQVGPVAKHVEGAALLLEVIAGPSKYDSTTVDVKVPMYRQKLKARKPVVGIVKEFKSMCDPAIYDVFEDALKVGKIKTKKVSLKHVDLAVQTYYPLVYAEFYSATRKLDGRKYGYRVEDKCGEEVLRRILGGKEILKAEHAGQYYRKALNARFVIKREVDTALSGVDVIASPTVPVLPHKIGAKVSPETEYAYDAFTIPANLAGNCAGVLPMGAVKKLPVGLQLMAPAFDEQLLVDSMYYFEKALGDHK